MIMYNTQKNWVRWYHKKKYINSKFVGFRSPYHFFLCDQQTAQFSVIVLHLSGICAGKFRHSHATSTRIKGPSSRQSVKMISYIYCHGKRSNKQKWHEISTYSVLTKKTNNFSHWNITFWNVEFIPFTWQFQNGCPCDTWENQTIQWWRDQFLLYKK